jgi:N-acetylmuramoyl-L-alanine amidase
MKKVVLDAGHGGPVPGCTGGNFVEKDIVLDIALRVGALLNRQCPDLEVLYTRKTDVNVDLAERANIANRARADLFVSIHADAVASTSPSGSSTWVMGMAKEEANLELAMRENSVITYEENYQTRYENFDPTDPVSYLKFALVQAAYLDQSVDLAALFQKHYRKNTTISTDRGVKQNIYLVLHRTTMPAVLTEIGFLSNASDRRYMTSEAGKEAIARSIAAAIGEYKSKVEENSRTLVADLSGADPVPVVLSVGEPSERAPAAVDAAVVFRVQVSASRSRINRSSRARFGEYAGKVEERRIGNYYKYFIGETNSYSEALSLQRRVREKFRDAFIVAFRDGEPTAVTNEMKGP